MLQAICICYGGRPDDRTFGLLCARWQSSGHEDLDFFIRPEQVFVDSRTGALPIVSYRMQATFGHADSDTAGTRDAHMQHLGFSMSNARQHGLYMYWKTSKGDKE